MSIADIIGITIGSIMLVFLILTWAGIVPKRFSESKYIGKLFKFDVVGIVILAVVRTIIYLAIAGKDIPIIFYILVPAIVMLLVSRK